MKELIKELQLARSAYESALNNDYVEELEEFGKYVFYSDLDMQSEIIRIVDKILNHEN